MTTLTSETDSIGRSALRKASLRLVPLIALGYGAAYIDRINVSFAALQMNRDLGFSPVGLRHRRRSLLHQLRAMRDPLQHPAGPLRSPPLAGPHHAHLGYYRHRHDVRPHALAVLQRALPIGHG